MKNKKFGLFIGICLLLGTALCVNSCNINHSSEELAKAYFTLFEYLYETDPALNHDSNYIALDLTNVKLTNTAPLIELIQKFCDSNGYILLQNNFEELVEKGYIKNLYFENGFLISFNDININENTLVTSARKWRSGTGAIGADYTVKKKGKIWEIAEIKNSWIS